MAKRFSKKYRNKGMSFLLPAIQKLCQDACQHLILHPCLKNHHHYFTILSSIEALDTKRPVVSPSPFYPASVVLFQLHGGMVSHMQVIPTPSSTVLNTKYLDPYH